MQSFIHLQFSNPFGLIRSSAIGDLEFRQTNALESTYLIFENEKKSEIYFFLGPSPTAFSTKLPLSAIKMIFIQLCWKIQTEFFSLIILFFN
jgi:hypothetical protein